jgi:hypothetical protein
MVYIPEISWAETPEMVMALALAAFAPLVCISELFGYSYFFVHLI